MADNDYRSNTQANTRADTGVMVKDRYAVIGNPFSPELWPKAGTPCGTLLDRLWAQPCYGNAGILWNSRNPVGGPPPKVTPRAERSANGA